MPASTRRTRSSGAPPGGHQQLDTTKCMTSLSASTASNVTRAVQAHDFCNVSTQTSTDLKNVPVSTPGKRGRPEDDDSANEHPSKRTQVHAGPQTEKKPFGFDRERNRSALFSAPPKANGLYSVSRSRNFLTTPSRSNVTPSRSFQTSRRARIQTDTFDDLPALRPTQSETPKKHASEDDERPHSADRARQSRQNNPSPQTPPDQSASFSRSLMGSIRRFIWGGGPVERPQTQDTRSVTESNTEEQTNSVRNDQSIPSTTRQNPLFSTAHHSNDNDETPSTSDHNKRPTSSKGSEPQTSPEPQADQTPRQSTTVDDHGSRKRKLPSMNGFVPGPRSGGFGIDDSYLDQDNQVDGIDESVLDLEPPVHTPSPKKRRIMDETPLQSAMKKSTSRIGTFPRSANNVRFAPNNSTQLLTPHYGRAGDYRGSTFLEPGHVFDDSSLSLAASDVLSPTTQMNTFQNATKLIPVNPGIRDPNDPDWRPSVANPVPGRFQLVYDDEEDDMQMSPEPSVFEQPSAPRISHAELPPPTSTVTETQTPSTNDNLSASASVEENLSKERSKAQKYKPAKASRLSQSFEARPDGSPPSATRNLEKSTASTTTEFQPSTSTEIILKPQAPVRLDNTIKGDDGMTDYEREHQYDDWAANLDWPKPQLYEDAGIGSAYMNKLIRDTWTDEDSRRSQSFWQAEFDKVAGMMDDAQSRGQRLVLVSGAE